MRDETKQTGETKRNQTKKTEEEKKMREKKRKKRPRDNNKKRKSQTKTYRINDKLTKTSLTWRSVSNIFS